jgi:hypothetical protein
MLAAALVALYFTHIFRYPIALAAVLGAAILVRGPRGLRAVAPAWLPAAALFAVWLMVRPAALRATPGPLALDVARFGELDWLWGSFEGPAEPRALRAGALVLAGVAVVSAVAGAVERRRSSFRSGPSRWWRARVAVVASACAGGSLLLFLVLPMKIGDWWYVYPREATAACFFGLALMPDLPRRRALREPLALAVAAASFPMALVVTRNYAAFDAATDDFAAITHPLPLAPKLLYLIFDHSGSNRTNSPFVHLPAYVQAERGGSLSHHLAIFGASPLHYRPREGRESVIPPPTPPCWEWTPEKFEVLERGRFFDWFLVRRADPPDAIFAADPAIVLSRHVGSWWLYERRAPREEPSALRVP